MDKITGIFKASEPHYLIMNREKLPGRSKKAISLLLWITAIIILPATGLVSCSSPKYLGRSPIPATFLEDTAISDALVGIAVYDADSKEYIYTYNGDKFFVPASNTKIPTLYAGLKYLGNGIPGIKYAEYNDTVYLRATGDPSFMLTDFPSQPVLRFMQETEKPMVIIDTEWRTGALGYGWPWNFYLDYYMPERSPFPIYGNIIIWAQRNMAGLDEDVSVISVFSHPGHKWPVEILQSPDRRFTVRRPPAANIYTVFPGEEGDIEMFVPFVTDGIQSAVQLLEDTLHRDIGVVKPEEGLPGYFNTIYSRPADSLFRKMMLYSDNFFAEQTLIMTSQELFGVMDEQMVIDYLLKNDLKDLPNTPRWVDGSGLSRYNLFSPLSFVWLLQKMKDEFGLERVCNLLPTGGEGTLENFFIEEKGSIYAKTGTLGGNAVTLSGFLITEKGRTLIFSVLVNNHNKDNSLVRIATESFLKKIIQRY